jgi:hypothetical protein
VRVRVKAPCRRRAHGLVSCLLSPVWYYLVLSCLLRLWALDPIVIVRWPFALACPFTTSPSPSPSFPFLTLPRLHSVRLPPHIDPVSVSLLLPTHLPAYQPPHPLLLHVHDSTTCCHPPSPACVLLPSWPLQLAPSHSSAVGRPSAFASPPPPNILTQTTPTAARHPRVRSRALQPKVRLAVLRTGSVSTMASATTRPTTSTAGTAALTRTGTLQAAPPTCALTVRATMRFCDHALIESRHESCWR